MAKGKKVTPADMAYIRINGAALDAHTIATHLGISDCYVYSLAKEMKVTLKPSAHYKKNRQPGEIYSKPHTDAHRMAYDIRRRKKELASQSSRQDQPPPVLSTQEQIFIKYGV